ncbi:MAG TPA: hypothetical protein VJT71_16640 [Pyrinomonadaceae bacterium]|nr:hypothetical protein [Pyrinomonadaceae bacterium]
MAVKAKWSGRSILRGWVMTLRLNTILELRIDGGGLGRLFPKGRFDPKFVNRLNENAQIMRQHFAKSFIDLCRARFTSQTVAKLGLNHAESGFDIRTLVIALHKPFTIEVVKMKTSVPKSPSS